MLVFSLPPSAAYLQPLGTSCSRARASLDLQLDFAMHAAAGCPEYSLRLTGGGTGTDGGKEPRARGDIQHRGHPRQVGRDRLDRRGGVGGDTGADLRRDRAARGRGGRPSEGTGILQPGPDHLPPHVLLPPDHQTPLSPCSPRLPPPPLLSLL